MKHKKILIFLASILLAVIFILLGLNYLFERAQFIAENISPDKKHKVILRDAEPGPEDIISYRYDLYSWKWFFWSKQYSIRCLLPIDPQAPEDSNTWMLTDHELLGWKDNTHFIMRVNISNDKRYRPKVAVINILSPKIPCVPNGF